MAELLLNDLPRGAVVLADRAYGKTGSIEALVALAFLERTISSVRLPRQQVGNEVPRSSAPPIW